MSDSRLRDIQALQYTHPAAAEALLLAFIAEVFPQLTIKAVELRPSAVSLNSFNGYLTLDSGVRLFFKTHVEPDSIVGEYYNSKLLEDAGYPIIRPALASTDYGKQFLIYDLVRSPSVFDLARAIDLGKQPDRLASLATAQHASDDQLAQLYARSLASQTAIDAAAAPVHQLFYHRLAGKRCQDFYFKGSQPNLPLTKRWLINGRPYLSTLAELLKGQSMIAPAQAGPSVIGHGDAHNGNVFATPNGLVYFDPAFAGRHHPLLDLAKPLFHNVFATWMYHPIDHPQAATLTFGESAETITVTFDESLPNSRTMFFTSKVDRVLTPTLIEMKRRGLLAENWRHFLKMALFCCPLLTMNLTDSRRFPEPVKWLGLSYAVMMGSDSDGSARSLIDRVLDDIQSAL